MTGIKQKVFADYDAAATWASIQETMRINFVLSKNRPIEISIEPWKDKRSVDANRYMWEMVTQIGRHLGSDDKRLTLDFLLDECFGTEHYAEIGGKQVKRRPRTSQFTKAQMSKFITWCLSWADQNAGPVMMPAEYEMWARS